MAQLGMESSRVLTCFANMVRCTILWRQHFTLRLHWKKNEQAISALVGVFCTNSNIFVRLKLSSKWWTGDWYQQFLEKRFSVQNALLTMLDFNKNEFNMSDNRPFARSGHMARNKLHWDASYAVGLSKQRKVGLDWYDFLCFESPTA